jgi:predicted nucleic acid-binding protein
MIVIDASVWVSFYLTGDAHHAITDAWFLSLEQRGDLLLAPTLLLAETAGAIGRRTGRTDLAQAVYRNMARLSTLRLVAIDRGLAIRASRLAANLRLRGAEACYVALAQALGLPLATWDFELQQRAGQVVSVLGPQL